MELVVQTRSVNKERKQPSLFVQVAYIDEARHSTLDVFRLANATSEAEHESSRQNRSQRKSPTSTPCHLVLASLPSRSARMEPTDRNNARRRDDRRPARPPLDPLVTQFDERGAPANAARGGPVRPPLSAVGRVSGAWPPASRRNSLTNGVNGARQETNGVNGVHQQTNGVIEVRQQTNGINGVRQETNGVIEVRQQTNGVNGVHGQTNGVNGVHGQTNGVNGVHQQTNGVYGVHQQTNGVYGVYQESDDFRAEVIRGLTRHSLHWPGRRQADPNTDEERLAHRAEMTTLMNSREAGTRVYNPPRVRAFAARTQVNGNGIGPQVNGNVTRSQVNGNGTGSPVNGNGTRSQVNGNGTGSQVNGNGHRSPGNGNGNRSDRV
ncbi:hypothetical protein C2857_000678 [Epichloe festucae Fl1]|uniref:Uncharacterized protein n=1 Tax=Epichloe festucae (strain Fl1) TaxID=877507 RepID=A0A7U3Q163_EPIFF|nr:hypothetical protein C2857_000678 [Epichloe festucae Fl1]